LSYVDNIFKPKPRETKFKLAQAQPKNFGEFVYLFLLNYELYTLRLFSSIFSKTTFWTYVVYDLDGRKFMLTNYLV